MGNFWDDVNPQSVADASDGFGEFNVGDNDAIIDKVEEGQSKSGNEMIIIHFKNETGARIRFYIVKDEYKLQKIKQLQLAFGIPMGNINTNSWLGRRGIVVCKQGKPYEGKVRNEVSFLRPRPAQNPPPNNNSRPNPPAQQQRDERPPIDPGYMTPQGQAQSDDGFDDDIPF